MKEEELKIIQSLSEKEKKALKEAARILWLDDSSDYGNALWEIIRILIGDDLFDDDSIDLYDIVEAAEYSEK